MRSTIRWPTITISIWVCMEILSRTLHWVTRFTGFHHHRRCVGLGIIHLVYVDNLLLFARDVSFVFTLVNYLNSFGVTVGLQANHLKSSIYMIGANKMTKRRLLQISSLQEGTLSFRYLNSSLRYLRITVAWLIWLLERSTLARKRHYPIHVS